MNADPSPKSLRISLVVANFPSLSQTFVSLQAAELVRRGHRVRIYGLGREGRTEWLPTGVDEDVSRITVRHLGSARWWRNSIRLPLFLPRVLYLLVKAPKATWLAMKDTLFGEEMATRRGPLKKQYRRFHDLVADAFLTRDISDSDIVHCQFSTLAPRILKLRGLGFIGERPKIACSVRGRDIMKKRSAEEVSWVSVFRGVDLFLPVCRSFESLLATMGCDKPIRVVGSPINLDHIVSTPEKRRPEEPIRIVSIGRLVEKKGLADALAAMVILKNQGIEFCYSVIGDGDRKDSLVDYVRTHKLIDCVQFLGPLRSGATLQILESCQILIAPSKTAEDGDSEGIPNVLKEAMFAGLQVVSTMHSGISELIKHEENGYLCAESDPEGLARAIRFVVEHPEKWRRLAENAARVIRIEYSPEKTTNDLLEAYRDVLP